MITYIEAVSQSVTPDSPTNQRERILIWLAALNESLPRGKKLSDTEIQNLARFLSKKMNND